MIRDHLKDVQPNIGKIKTIDIVKEHIKELYELKNKKYTYEQLHKAFIKETGRKIKINTFKTYYKLMKIEVLGTKEKG
ncbi:hypothetical protein GCM10023116_29740 [Kistimonas scapharcae]|uniref:Uncharacterized protein n=1 Tax=Kistimonas scapharcae TaxID=1036133 RepID=A0ABP8V5W9_9GAMM